MNTENRYLDLILASKRQRISQAEIGRRLAPILGREVSRATVNHVFFGRVRKAELREGIAAILGLSPDFWSE